MLQPGLEVAATSLNDGARVEAIRREPCERGLVEVGERHIPIRKEVVDHDSAAEGQP